MRSLRDFLTGGLLLYAAVANTQDVSFGTDVQPILAKRCFACHGPAEQEAGLALNELSRASAELDSGERAIVIGDPDASTLLARVTSADPDVRMPPEGKPLTRRRGSCGIEYSDMIPHIASMADDIALIRTMHGEQFNHHPGQLLLSCGKADMGRPTIGSWLLYGLGNEAQNLPGYVVLTAGRGASGGSSNWSSGFLPSTYQGVPFRGGSEPVLYLNNPPGVARPNQQRAINTIGALNQFRYESNQDPEIASRIEQYELAFRMQSAAPELTDLTGETQDTLDMYGVGRKTPRPTAEMQNGETFNRFSTNCLLARRLVKRGVRFVNIVHASWDQHGNLKHDLAWNCRMADQPVAALLKDLKQRGMLDDTLVVWASEFGRTPLGQGSDGRDHHPFAFSMWMAGGGARGGSVYGVTDEIGWAPAENPVHVNDFQATLLHMFGLDHEHLTIRHRGLDVRLTNLGGKVIHEVFA